MGGVKLFGALRCAPFQSLISVKPAERQLRDVDAVFLFTTAALLPGLALCKCLLSNSSSDLPFSFAFSRWLFLTRSLPSPPPALLTSAFIQK